MPNQWKMRKSILITNIIILIILSVSCSENPPEIEQVFWQSNRLNDMDNDTVYDTLSVFIQVTDPDGIEDLDSLYVINDKEELFWKLDENNWIIKENRGVTWLGSNLLKMADRSMFLSGEYRVLVIDDAGERMETSFVLKNSSFMPDKDKFPDITLKGKSAVNPLNTHVIWTYSSDSNVLTENYTDGGMKSFPLNESMESLYLFRYDRINGVGLISGPYTVKK